MNQRLFSPAASGGASPALAMLGVNLMVFMATLDMSIVNVALPTLVTVLDTDFAAIQWVILSYVLVIASLLLLVSRLGDMRDKKRIFSAGLVIFLVASLCCGLLDAVTEMVVDQQQRHRFESAVHR